MQLTAEQMTQFEEAGYFFIPEAFSAEEVALMRNAALDIFAQPREQIWREKNGAPRTAFACHTYNHLFNILSRHPRLVEQGAEVVILGCTELELLLGPQDCAVPLLPTAQLHVEAAVEAALAVTDTADR